MARRSHREEHSEKTDETVNVYITCEHERSFWNEISRVRRVSICRIKGYLSSLIGQGLDKCPLL